MKKIRTSVQLKDEQGCPLVPGRVQNRTVKTALLNPATKGTMMWLKARNVVNIDHF
jgi:hypothetical protein